MCGDLGTSVAHLAWWRGDVDSIRSSPSGVTRHALTMVDKHRVSDAIEPRDREVDFRQMANGGWVRKSQ